MGAVVFWRGECGVRREGAMFEDRNGMERWEHPSTRVQVCGEGTGPVGPLPPAVGRIVPEWKGRETNVVSNG